MILDRDGPQRIEHVRLAIVYSTAENLQESLAPAFFKPNTPVVQTATEGTNTRGSELQWSGILKALCRAYGLSPQRAKDY